MKPFSKTRRSVLGAVLAACLVLLLSGALDRAGTRYLDQALNRSLVTFAVARALNGVISVVQGTQFSVEPPVVSVHLAIGQVLDPVNDLVEQFSWIMLASAASIGIQKVGIQILGGQWFTVLLALLLALLILSCLREKWLQQPVMRRLLAIVGLMLLVRFSAGLVALGNAVVYQQFIQPEYEKTYAAIESSRKRIGEINGILQSDAAGTEESMMDTARKFISNVGESINVKSLVSKYESEAENAARNIVHMITVFLLETVIMPLLFLLLLYATARGVWRYGREHG